ncbi:superoxide dismutase [Halopelagius longus]|uniref:Superoxide dismutase n=1 Tax=Halopelagius longus TaxID=1236180 RepID=A0A1H0ZDI2_9EURY|nr:superoxide dismutase [Halopelagius longus]RDI73155.1 superoxide dismutase [Halopelagius longus]SDQ25472.1 superoxide dismutase, Fe-Mn family [Halopelagius longus]
MATYELPELPYDYDALEPVIDERIMELHHDKHHQGYVDGANSALEQLEQMRESGDMGNIKAVKRNLAFNLSGHVNHTVFWENMSPDGGGEPGGELADAFDEQFGGFEQFKSDFAAASKGVEGSGWGQLVYDHAADRLIVTAVENHQNQQASGSTPILVLDVWEHAYYLQYENNRGEYVDSFWDVVNWDDVAQRYEQAQNADVVGQHTH